MPTDLDLQDETAEVLAKLIAFRTVNPPGDERACLEWLAGYLDDAGLDVSLVGAEPERPNLVARLDGAADGPVLGYLSHVDTVLADPADWQADPWGGEIRDGHLWGRGAIDMKSQTAAEAVAAAHLARTGARPARGTLKVIAVSDEETGGAIGAQWLTREHADLARCDYLLNEGAGAVMELGGRRAYGVCCAEKGTIRFIVRARGEAAHASVPATADNALLKLARAVTALGDFRSPPDLTEPALALLQALGHDPDDTEAAVAAIRAESPLLAGLVDAMLRVTLAPTVISASTKINVIPARAEVQVDARVPPGMGRDGALARGREALGDLVDVVELDVFEEVMGHASPVASPLMDAISQWVGERDPGAIAVPSMLPAFSDSSWFRAAYPDIVAYGFFPHFHQPLTETWPLLHARDERIDVRDLGFAADCFASLPGILLA